jgi:hypothetical protein
VSHTWNCAINLRRDAGTYESRGRFIAVEFSTRGLDNAAPGTGAVVRVPPHSTTPVTIVGGLNFPGGFAAGPKRRLVRVHLEHRARRERRRPNRPSLEPRPGWVWQLTRRVRRLRGLLFAPRFDQRVPSFRGAPLGYEPSLVSRH